jgi:hypothetical protein
MRIVYSCGFSAVERMAWKNVIFRHLVEAFLCLIEEMESRQIELENADNIVRLFYFSLG